VIVVDTSIWVETIRRPASPHAAALRQLLDADDVALALPVRIELVSGSATRSRAPLKRGLSALPVLRPTDATWSLIEGWVEPAADRGFHFSVTDLLIAGLAHEIGGLVWTRDADFEDMARLGLVRLYAPPKS